MKKTKHAVLSLSGGLDSSTLLLHLLSTNHSVTCLSYSYGQKHSVELERAQSLVKYLQDKGYDLKHQVITLDGLSNLLVSG